MLFDEAGVLPERLKDETCTLAAQDDSFFAQSFTDPAFAGVSTRSSALHGCRGEWRSPATAARNWRARST